MSLVTSTRKFTPSRVQRLADRIAAGWLRAADQMEPDLEDVNASALAAKLERKGVTVLDELARLQVPAENSFAVTKSDCTLLFSDDHDALLEILVQIRKNTVGETDEALCIEIMRFTSSSMALGAPERMESASKTLEGGISSCGGYSLVFCELCRAAGIPARYLGLFGIPMTGSHALAEVYFNDKWHLFDPTFAIFCYSRNAYDQKGHILSASEIVTQDEAPFLMQVVEKPWGEDYETARDCPVHPLPEEPTTHVLTYWDDAGRRIIFPAAFGNDSIISVPVDIDLRNGVRYSVGEPSGEWLDTWLECIDDPRKGYFLLGATCPRIYHYVRLKTETWSRVRATYLATPESDGKLEIFPLAGCYLKKNHVNGLETRFELCTNRSDPAFMLMSEGPVWIDTMTYETLANDR